MLVGGGSSLSHDTCRLLFHVDNAAKSHWRLRFVADLMLVLALWDIISLKRGWLALDLVLWASHDGSLSLG